MKKLSWLFLVGLMAVFTFTACSNADDDDPTDEGGGVVPPVEATGTGTETDPYNVTAAIEQGNNKSIAWVKGYIVGQIPGPDVTEAQFAAPFSSYNKDDSGAITEASEGSNLLIAANKAETNVAKCIIVQLKRGTKLCEDLNLVTKPDNLHKELLVQGTLDAYFKNAGLKSTTAAKLDGVSVGVVEGVTGNGTLANPYNVAGIRANQGASAKFAKGYIVGCLSGTTVDGGAVFTAPFATDNNLLIADNADETDVNNCAVIRVGSSFRTGLGLNTNASNKGKLVIMQGDFAATYGGDGITLLYYAKLGDKEFGEIKVVEEIGDIIFSENFDKGMGGFTAQNVEGEQVWKFDATYKYVSMSAYANGSTFANEDWLISPAINLTGVSSAVITFQQAFGPKSSGIDKTLYSVLASTESDGTNVNVNWYPISISYPSASDWAWMSSGVSVLPSEVQGKSNVRIAFKYKNSATQATATWEVKEVKVAKAK